MKKKVNQNVAYKEWNMGPNLGSKNGLRDSAQTPLKPPAPRPDIQSNLKRMDSGSSLSDEDDYQEGFEENVGDDSGMNEMDRLRKAMEKEKQKAQRHNIKNSNKQLTESKPKPGPLHNPLKLEKNLDGFVKQKGLIVGERVDHAAANSQVSRAQELRELI